MVKFIVTILLNSVVVYTMAQSDKELFHLKYGASPISLNGGKDALHTLDFNFKFPLHGHSNSILAGGVGFESLWTNHHPIFDGKSVQGISTQLFFNHTLNNGNGLLAFGAVGAYSDFNDISSEDFRYSFGVRYKTRLHERFTLSYGLGLSKQFFGVMIAPFVDFDWKINNRLRLSGPLPVNTHLRYTINPKAELIFFLKPDNVTYRLSKDEHESRYFQKKQWNACLGFDYQLTRHWLLTFRTGFSLRRKFEIYEASQTGTVSILTFDLRGQTRVPYYYYQQNALFAEIILAWVIPRD